MPGRKASQEVRREEILQAAYEVATEEGIGGLTIRAVAARAKLSHGLVHFHFQRKGELLPALLDRVLTKTTVLDVPEHIARQPRALDRLHALLRQEMERLSHEPRRTRLFLEFWALGARQAPIRTRISAALERYRGAFRETVDEVLRTEAVPFAGATADGLAAVAVSWIQGCAVQAMIDPEHFDIEQYLAAVGGLTSQLTGSPG